MAEDANYVIRYTLDGDWFVPQHGLGGYTPFLQRAATFSTIELADQACKHKTETVVAIADLINAPGTSVRASQHGRDALAGECAALQHFADVAAGYAEF
jgi:hypothetical protein